MELDLNYWLQWGPFAVGCVVVIFQLWRSNDKKDKTIASLNMEHAIQ